MRNYASLVFAAVLALGAGCTTIPEPGPSGSFDVRTAMQRDLNPAVLAIWEVTNNAMNDDGGIDPALMDAAKWRQVAAGAARLSVSAHSMAAASEYLAAAPGNTDVNEGELTMAEVQRLIDSDPMLFRERSAALAAHADKVVAAAEARDPAATGDLVAEIDGMCASCHSRFWHPQ